MPAEFLKHVQSIAAGQEGLEVLLLVGSYARGTMGPNSDIDLLLVCREPQKFLNEPGFAATFGEVEKTGIENWGACTSLRVFYKTGLEVEFGFVHLNWLALPPDGGTKQVLAGGYKLLYDKSGFFAEFEKACAL